jgi:hypothetical protein
VPGLSLLALTLVLLLPRIARCSDVVRFFRFCSFRSS